MSIQRPTAAAAATALPSRAGRPQRLEQRRVLTTRAPLRICFARNTASEIPAEHQLSLAAAEHCRRAETTAGLSWLVTVCGLRLKSAAVAQPVRDHLASFRQKWVIGRFNRTLPRWWFSNTIFRFVTRILHATMHG